MITLKLFKKWAKKIKSHVRNVYQTLRKPKLTFVLSGSKNYVKVQSQINSLIQKHMRSLSYFETNRDRVDDEMSLKFGLFISYKHDILMSHGVADKNYLFKKDEQGNLLINSCKHVLVPGPWLKRRLLNNRKITLNEKQIHCVGWPRLDALLELQAQFSERKISKLKHQGRPRVLWAPTHDFKKRGEENISTSSYPALGEHKEYFLEKFDLDFSPHPRNRDEKQPTAEKLVLSDIVISDFGTMLYEAWALGKPVIFPTWLIGDRIQTYLKGSAEAHIYRNRIGLHAESPEDVVKFVAESDFRIGDDVKEFMKDYLPAKYRFNSGYLVAKTLLKCSYPKSWRVLLK